MLRAAMNAHNIYTPILKPVAVGADVFWVLAVNCRERALGPLVTALLSGRICCCFFYNLF